ncbi:MAG: hypothetical protein KKE30_10565 [Gammaproteobacteria bacterium]|nr:hypothetical protein [Gammaproteobacteria bacterium]MBU1553661.1 hypothetical protein [Gammaproteobacteria bacterium]MBU2071379.1 hypothetical protein [Gammaproteobacteria bacterium]MBU2182391.1 hypothetical protein [Gammaproteobacteria bacterium]MBU2204129.1 hypothetical protein [Gammaproteobacteria bacterium]
MLMLMNPKFTCKLPNKSRLAGFFVFALLTACNQAPSQDALIARAQTEPAVALSLAAQRLASGETDAALQFFQLAATAGDSTALSHALALQQRLHGRLSAASWLAQQWQLGLITADAVSQAQRAELGLWPQHKPTVDAYASAAGCQLTVQPVASQQQGVARWHTLLQAWQQDGQLAALPVCFNALHVINSTQLRCSEQSNSRISCHYPSLQTLVSTGEFSQLLVVAGRGTASYNNGILQLPDTASLALLRHEFMHVLGFIDEYALADSIATEVCQPDKIYPNLLIKADADAYQQHWQLPDAPQLTAVDTCQAMGIQAYRVIAQDNLMRFYELGLPAEYFALAQQILAQPDKLMPVQYYFAYLARQQQNWPLWQQLMQQAADQGYADASSALAP